MHVFIWQNTDAQIESRTLVLWTRGKNKCIWKVAEEPLAGGHWQLCYFYVSVYQFRMQVRGQRLWYNQLCVPRTYYSVWNLVGSWLSVDLFYSFFKNWVVFSLLSHRSFQIYFGYMSSADTCLVNIFFSQSTACLCVWVLPYPYFSIQSRLPQQQKARRPLFCICGGKLFLFFLSFRYR